MSQPMLKDAPKRSVAGKKNKKENYKAKMKLKGAQKLKDAMERESKKPAINRHIGLADSVPHIASINQTKSVMHRSPKSIDELLKIFTMEPAQFDRDLVQKGQMLGSGAYGTVHNCQVISLPGFPMVAKEIKDIRSVQLIKAERRILHALNGIPVFPYCVGYVEPNIILIQKIGSGCTLSSAFMTGCNVDGLSISRQIITGVNLLHKRFRILHNDLHASNILIDIAANRCVIIDFGKATPVDHPVIYDLTPSQRERYNKHHRHIAYEIRNERFTRQSVATDTYSVGFLIKRIGFYLSPQNDKVCEVGKRLKSVELSSRITLDNALQQLN